MQQRGTLKVWNEQKGFGFIAPEQGGPDVFAHISALRGDGRPVAGAAVRYVAGRDARGRLRARHICLEVPDSAAQHQFRRKLLVLLALVALPLWGSLQAALLQYSLLPLLAYGLVSVLALLLYWYDKQSAQQGRRRIPENALHLCELAGGWPGALLAQQLFRHKTRKASYQAWFWGIVLLHQVFWIDYLYLGQVFGSAFVQRIIG